MSDGLFPALLKYWRTRRGRSQLDLALEADVSARHISFLESGRARPRPGMILRLMATLEVPLREQNRALRAAGFEPRFDEPALERIAPAIDQAITRMMQQQEPYPLTVLSPTGDILRSNRAATRLFATFVAEAAPADAVAPPNLFVMLFDPRAMRPFVEDWARLARATLSRLQRDALAPGADARLAALTARLSAYPGVPRAWRQPDFESDPEATLTIRLRRGPLAVGFLVTVTAFSAPQQVTLEELRIESCFPLDEPTRRVCEALAAGEPPAG